MVLLAHLTVLYFTVILFSQKLVPANAAPVSGPASNSFRAAINGREGTETTLQQRDLRRLRRETQSASQALFDSIVKMENRQRQDRAQSNRLMTGAKIVPKSKQIISLILGRSHRIQSY